MDTPDNELQELLESLDPATRTMVAEVDLGQQAKEFMASELGQHLIGCLHKELTVATDALASTSPWLFWRVQALQNRIWRAKFMLVWLRELLIGGKSAQAALNEVEAENG